ncbi:ABC transporter ATP-binding protein [Defluviimonas sp. WL0050]|uniref:ABC transporter ATP-binding protein n=1 Tax=Albidovulum litorale TaxID=2984134 RepID=A0ABT2ZLI2_9RHOB|nr:ABC transporter ATP-binding protein [Defluviimonas sp. WL0050]MCV2871995.1 ABC transporter ATP-binding protein [Defluviimonas sp. WL0050]
MTEGAASGGLRLQALTKRFGSFTAAENVNLDIRRGEFLTLLGPSGSGKTTLLMMIAGFLDITEGDILLDGTSIAGMPPEKRNFGMVFQGYALFPHMSVRQNIAYPLDVRKRPKAEIEARVDEMLDLVQLQDFGHRLPGQLSGGQQQRVALARALCFAPPVLLLDEPLGALDKKLRIEVQAQLKDIHRRVGTTFIYVTHDQEEALSMSDRIVIMQQGRIEQVGTPEELYQKPRTRFAASFLGKSNFLTRDGALYALRPEKIDIAPKGAGQGPNTLSGTVRAMTYFGSTLKYDVTVPGMDEVEVDADAWRGGAPLPEGTDVDLSWSDAAAVRLESD